MARRSLPRGDVPERSHWPVEIVGYIMAEDEENSGGVGRLDSGIYVAKYSSSLCSSSSSIETFLLCLLKSISAISIIVLSGSVDHSYMTDIAPFVPRR